MKVKYITDDGKVFTSRAEAEAYEVKLNQTDVEEKKKEIMKKIEANDKAIAELKEAAFKLLDENDALLAEFKSLLPSDVQKDLDDFTKFIESLMDKD